MVSAVPIPEIDWLKDGQVLRSSHRFKISQFGNEHTLTIDPIQNRDFGKYICKASNHLGIEEQVIELKEINNSETEELLVEIVELSPPGYRESLTMISSGESKGQHTNIVKETIAVDLFSVKYIQKTERGWIAIIAPYSTPDAKVNLPIKSAASTVTINSMVFLFWCIFLLMHY